VFWSWMSQRWLLVRGELALSNNRLLSCSLYVRRSNTGVAGAAATVSVSAGVALPPGGSGTAQQEQRRSPRRQLPPQERAGPAVEQPAGPADAPVVTLRTIAQLRKTEDPGLSKLLREAGLPTGPWATDGLALADIDAAAKDLSVGGGGFSVMWGGTKPAVIGRRGHGKLHVMFCHERHKNKSDCRWTLTLEECVEGWAIRSAHLDPGEGGHSHGLLHTTTEVMARSSMRSIPPHLVDLGKAMVLSGIAPSKVHVFLKAQAEKEGSKAVFNYNDVYHACSASTGERRLDATKLVEMLRQREVDRGLFQRITTDEDGCLKEVFFQLDGSTEIYANELERQVVEIDHKVRPFSAAPAIIESTYNNYSTAPTRTG